ncbi:MAG TPA: hypothetical protein DCS93_39585 [Microscillaceae bacterium]|nr:hypothetical protein [Microscillaceae bacterium]
MPSKAPHPSLGLAPHSSNVVVQSGRNRRGEATASNVPPWMGRLGGAWLMFNFFDKNMGKLKIPVLPWEIT